jgi:hypothetical protein
MEGLQAIVIRRSDYCEQFVSCSLGHLKGGAVDTPVLLLAFFQPRAPPAAFRRCHNDSIASGDERTKVGYHFHTTKDRMVRRHVSGSNRCAELTSYYFSHGECGVADTPHG